MRRGQISQVAQSIPFDNDTNGFASTDVQGAIEEQYITGGISASPGYSWERAGNTPSGSWLSNGLVTSNTTGRIFALYNGKLTQVAVSNELSNTFSVEIYEHDGATYTLLYTISLSAQRSKIMDVSGVSITRGKELAAKVSSGSCKNPVVQILAKGTISP